jgi:Retroviral aspartyl protease
VERLVNTKFESVREREQRAAKEAAMDKLVDTVARLQTELESLKQQKSNVPFQRNAEPRFPYNPNQQLYCRWCKRMGHIAENCRQRRPDNSQDIRNRNVRSPNVRNNDPPATNAPIAGLPGSIIRIPINGIYLRALFDTGATMSLIKQDALPDIIATMVHDRRKARTVNSIAIPILGNYEAQVEIGGTTVKSKFAVVHNILYDCIIGRDIIIRLPPYYMDLRTQTLKFVSPQLLELMQQSGLPSYDVPISFIKDEEKFEDLEKDEDPENELLPQPERFRYDSEDEEMGYDPFELVAAASHWNIPSEGMNQQPDLPNVPLNVPTKGEDVMEADAQSECLDSFYKSTEAELLSDFLQAPQHGMKRSLSETDLPRYMPEGYPFFPSGKRRSNYSNSFPRNVEYQLGNVNYPSEDEDAIDFEVATITEQLERTYISNYRDPVAQWLQHRQPATPMESPSPIIPKVPVSSPEPIPEFWNPVPQKNQASR